MTQERRGERVRPPERRDGPVVATTEHTGEGEVYYTGPRAGPDRAPAAGAPTTFAVLRDRIRWGPIFAGLVTGLTALLVFLMLGVAIGLSIFGPGSATGVIGAAAGIWSGVSAFLAFIIGGWVAGKTAAVENVDNALLNGFMVGAAAVVLILFMVAIGFSNLFGVLGGAANGIIGAATTNPGALQNSASSAGSAVNNATASAAQAQGPASAAAWYTFGSIVIALIAATLGGWFGYISRHGHDLDAHLGRQRPGRVR